jgi:glycosyltransferase involved in cell wall biosynthesis
MDVMERPAATKSLQNKKGNVLLVSYYLPPDISPGSLRISGLMDGLLRSQWNVSAISVKRTPPGTLDTSSLDWIPPDIEVTRTSHWDAYGGIRKLFRLDKNASRIEKNDGSIGHIDSGGGNRLREKMRRVIRLPLAAICRLLEFPDRYAGWVLPLLFKAGKIIGVQKTDIVLSSSPPHSSHLAILLLSYFKHFKWVTDFRDPWTAPNRHGRGGFFLAARRLLERHVLRRCDRIIANTPGNREALLSAFTFLDKQKVTVITNAFDKREASLDIEPNVESRRCDLVYMGEIYLGMLDLLLDAMQIIAKRKSRVLPVIHIYGLVNQQDLNQIARLGLEEHFKYFGFVPYRRSLQIMKEASALLLLLPRKGDSASWVPSKLYRYIGCGRPVLAVAPAGDAASIISETGAGLAVTDADPETIADKLSAFVEAIRNGTLPFERKEEKIRNYSMDSIVSQLDQILLEEMGV